MSDKKYPSNLYLESVTTSVDFASHVSVEAVIVMAKELLALRKAFSEPVVWAHVDELDKAVKVNGDGMMCGFGYVTKDWTAPNTILLYRKPQNSTT